ncbi:MAG: 4-(cytidine 5'-diphospho)-2-C-methyl-D-erythritol kinase [Verrucomicrobia bacterium]|nr:4-(cytidine 5'-diphospho)-2-C-methyl-D-erythritol kinase [Verrucomicrobiota bacterium]
MSEYLSPCKVNLMLNILGRRPDGFHDLETLFLPVPVYDRIEISREETPFQFTCSTDKIPTGPENLVYRAAMGFFARAQIEPRGKIHLVKNLPSEAGLGGGSANAAVTLKSLNQEFGNPLSANDLHELAAPLGSDVPFFLLDAPAIGRGRGEKLIELPRFKVLENVWILLMKPDFGVSTGWAYKALANYPVHQKGRPGRVEEFVEALSSFTLKEAAPLFYNSLEAPVLAEYPILAEYQKFLRENGADVTLMSGSGSTTFALISDPAQAKRLPDLLRERFGGNMWIASAKL